MPSKLGDKSVVDLIYWLGQNFTIVDEFMFREKSTGKCFAAKGIYKKYIEEKWKKLQP